MSNQKCGNDNELLVEFEFLVDLDMAIFKYIQANFSDSKYVDQKVISMRNDYFIIRMLLYRDHINPLEVIMPKEDTTNLYFEIHNKKEEELLKYALLQDTFYLMATFINNASSVGITVWCKNKLESDFIKSKNPNLTTIIVPKRSMIDTSKYTAIYTKFAAHVIEYGHLEGKYIYIAAAKYNFNEDNTVNTILTMLYGDVNIIKLIDIYTKVKYRFEKGDNNDDLLEHSSREESKTDSEGDPGYYF